MSQSNRLLRAAIILASFAAAAAPVIARSSNVVPQAPTQVCVNNKCKNSSPAAPADPSGAIKFHPGHYVFLDGHNLSDGTVAKHLAAIDRLADEPSVRGVQLISMWAYLEGPTPGDYSRGFAMLDQYLAHLKKINKQLILGIQERGFGSGVPSQDALMKRFPAYLASPKYDGGWAVTAGQPHAAGGLVAICRVWDPAVMDRLIALTAALGARYNSNPNFEMIELGETAISGADKFGYTADRYGEQLKRWGAAARAAFPNTAVRLYANFFGSDAQMKDLMATFVDRVKSTVGPPDVVPGSNAQANKIFAGGSGSRDFRGVVPYVAEVQMIGVSYGKKFNPSDFYESVENTLPPSYFLWYQNTYAGTPQQQWATGILPYIRSLKGAVPAESCPSAYSGGCITH